MGEFTRRSGRAVALATGHTLLSPAGKPAVRRRRRLKPTRRFRGGFTLRSRRAVAGRDEGPGALPVHESGESDLSALDGFTMRISSPVGQYRDLYVVVNAADMPKKQQFGSLGMRALECFGVVTLRIRDNLRNESHGEAVHWRSTQRLMRH